MRLSLGRGLTVKLAVVMAMLAVPATGLALDDQPRQDQGSTAPATDPPDHDVLLVEPAAETPPAIAGAEGPLTRQREGSASAIVRDFLRKRRGTYGLDAGEVRRLEVADSFAWGGLRHTRLEQSYRGIPALQPAVSGTVDEDGRLLTVTGAPAPDLSAPTTVPAIGAAEAVKRVLSTAGDPEPVGGGDPQGGPERETVFAGGHRASLVLVPDGGSESGDAPARLAWAVLAFADSRHILRGVVDAATGAVLERRNLVAGASALAFPNYPDAPGPGGQQQSMPLRTGGGDPWLTSFQRLEGDNAIVYSDENDDIYEFFNAAGEPTVMPQTSDHIPPSSGAGTPSAAWSYEPEYFQSQDPTKMFCPVVVVAGVPEERCTWNDFTFAGAFSWRDNREQAGAQAFWLVNHFHDHLQDDPSIAFTDQLGNFEETVDDPQPGEDRDSDPVHVQILDGADTHPKDAGFPGCMSAPALPKLPECYVNNANMATLPEGISPRMQLYLFSNFYETADPSSRVRDVNGADDATIVYHEYAHGLSSRLVCCDSSGYTTLAGAQGGALGEGWSDWYALDLLEEEGHVVDAPNVADMTIGAYENARLRTQPTDCRVGVASDPVCPGWGSAGAGGYTFGDFAKIVEVDEVNNVTGTAGPDGIPDGQVHADGEIWGGTLWDLRRALIAAHGRPEGIARARTLVTGSMILVSGTSPDFVDMRDAILRMDEVQHASADKVLIWGVFAARGLGFGASAAGPNDTRPAESFTDPTKLTPTDPNPPGIGPQQPPTTTTPTTTTPSGETPSEDADRSPVARASFRGTKRRLRVNRRGRFAFAFRATAGVDGAVAFVTSKRVRVASKRRRVRLARVAFTAPANQRVRVRPGLSRANLALLRRHRKLALRVTVRLTDAAGHARRTRMDVTLLRPRRR